MIEGWSGENLGCGRWMDTFAGGGRKQRINAGEDGRVAVLVLVPGKV